MVVYDLKVKKYWDGLTINQRTKLLNLWSLNNTSPTTKYNMLSTSEKKEINEKFYVEIAQ